MAWRQVFIGKKLVGAFSAAECVWASKFVGDPPGNQKVVIVQS
jgi:hypothetical protein